jgi:hypothetical protein
MGSTNKSWVRNGRKGSHLYSAWPFPPFIHHGMRKTLSFWLHKPWLFLLLPLQFCLHCWHSFFHAWVYNYFKVCCRCWSLSVNLSFHPLSVGLLLRARHCLGTGDNTCRPASLGRAWVQWPWQCVTKSCGKVSWKKSGEGESHAGWKMVKMSWRRLCFDRNLKVEYESLLSSSYPV